MYVCMYVSGALDRPMELLLSGSTVVLCGELGCF